jgi:hypothetical protein
MNNWKEEFKKILNANYVWTWDLLKAVEKFIENLLEEAKKEERDRIWELLFSKIIWTDDIAKIFKN